MTTQQAESLLSQLTVSACKVEAAVVLHPRVTDLEDYLVAIAQLFRNGGRPQAYGDDDNPSAEDDRETLQVRCQLGPLGGEGGGWLFSRREWLCFARPGEMVELPSG